MRRIEALSAQLARRVRSSRTFDSSEDEERRKKMKNYVLIALAACVAFVTLAATPSHAQTLIKANVPFDFCAGYGQLPASEYSITRTGLNVMVLMDGRGHGVELMTPRVTDLRSDIEVPKLVFHRYGNEYFLAEIWSNADGSVRKLAVNRREKQLARNGAPPQVAVVYGVVATANGN